MTIINSETKDNLNKEEADFIKQAESLIEKMNSTPESEKHQISQRLLDRMQSETEAGYGSNPPTEAQRKRANEILYGKDKSK